MAIFSGTGASYLARTGSGFPTSTTQSWCAWIYLTGNGATGNALYNTSNSAGTVFDALGITNATTQLRLFTSGTSATGTTLSTSTWYHVAFTRTGNTRTLYLNGVSDATLSTAESFTPGADALGSNGAVAFPGRFAAFKQWNAALTQAEVVNEMRTYLPQRTANLSSFAPFFHNTYLRNIATGVSWTATGTITTADGPPLSWGSPVLFPPEESSVPAGTTYSDSLTEDVAVADSLIDVAVFDDDPVETVTVADSWYATPDKPTYMAIGTGASGTTSCTPSYPAVPPHDYALYCFVTGRSDTANTAPTITGWTSIASHENGIGTWASATGTRRVEIFKKDSVSGSESGTITVNLAGNANNTLYASIVAVAMPGGKSAAEETSVNADVVNDTSFFQNGLTQINYTAGDLQFILIAQNSDTATVSAQDSSAGTATFETLVNLANVAVTDGFDHRHILWKQQVLTGSSAIEPFYGHTNSSATSGPLAFLRVRAGVSSNTYSDSLTEAVTVGDTVVDAVVLVEGVSEGVTLADLITQINLLADTFTDSVTTGDSLTDAYVNVEAQTETVTVADALADSMTLAEAFSDTVTATDLMDSYMLFDMAITEAVTVGDAAADANLMAEAFSDDVTLGDSQQGGLLFSEAFSDGPTVGDAVDPTQAFPEAFSESITVGDSLVETFVPAEAFIEAVTVGDAMLDTMAGANETLPETVTVADVMDSLTLASDAFTDTVTVGDSITTAADSLDAVTETVTVGDTLQSGQVFSEAMTEAIAVADSLVDAQVVVAAITESVALADDFVGALVGVPTTFSELLQETVTVGDGYADALVSVAPQNGGGDWWLLKKRREGSR